MTGSASANAAAEFIAQAEAILPCAAATEARNLLAGMASWFRAGVALFDEVPIALVAAERELAEAFVEDRTGLPATVIATMFHLGLDINNRSGASREHRSTRPTIQLFLQTGE
jgi:hypothetical protein